MASLAATNWPKPLVLVPCLSWSTASGVFTQGVLSGAINWDMLMDQYYSDGKYREEIKKMLYFPEEVFKAGQHFAQTFPESMDRIKELSTEVNLRTKSQSNNTSHSLNVERSATVSESVLSAERVGSRNVNPVIERNVLNEMSSFDVENQGYSLKQRTEVSSRQVLGEVEPKEQLEVNLMRAAVLGGGHTVASPRDNLQGGTMMEAEKMQSDSGESEKLKIMTRNVLKILSPSKLINAKSILAGFHESKSNLLRRNGKSANAQNTPTKDNVVKKEALQFMRGIMDECTHLKSFEVPFDPDLIIAVTAKDDGYVPQEGVTDLRDIWPGIEVRNLNAGHVSAYVLYQHTFREAIKDAFDRAARKYYSGNKLKS